MIAALALERAHRRLSGDPLPPEGLRDPEPVGPPVRRQHEAHHAVRLAGEARAGAARLAVHVRRAQARPGAIRRAVGALAEEYQAQAAEVIGDGHYAGQGNPLGARRGDPRGAP